MEIINENSELKSKIECLSYEIDNLKRDNQELKKENQELKKEIKELKKDNNEKNIRLTKLEKENEIFKLKIKKMDFNKLQTLIITAIQDINSYDLLENKINSLFKSALIKLRKNRNNINHYIDINDDSDEIIKYKKMILNNYLSSLSNEERYTINKRYSQNDFINEIIIYLN